MDGPDEEDCQDQGYEGANGEGYARHGVHIDSIVQTGGLSNDDDNIEAQNGPAAGMGHHQNIPKALPFAAQAQRTTHVSLVGFQIMQSGDAMTIDHVEIRGLEEVQRKMEQVVEDLQGPPFLQGMRDATLIVTRDAKINAPVDTGRLRASITPEVRAHGPTVQGVVGSNVIYAPYMEMGTRPHFPPLEAMEPWARRHGMTAWQVAIAIARKGTKARRYLQKALEDNAEKIFNLLGKIVGLIVKR